MSSEEYKKRLENALQSYYKNQTGKKFDVSGYPENVQDILDVFCTLWNCRPPVNKKDKGFWIESCRRLIEACAEFDTELLHLVRLEFGEYMKENGGIAPFRVGHPGALIKTVQGKASELRTLAENPVEEEKSIFDQYRSENKL